MKRNETGWSGGQFKPHKAEIPKFNPDAEPRNGHEGTRAISTSRDFYEEDNFGSDAAPDDGVALFCADGARLDRAELAEAWNDRAARPGDNAGWQDRADVE